MSERALETIARRLEEVNLSTDRFVDVQAGEKRCLDHNQLPPEEVSGNYGIYVNGADFLVILDVDDYGDLDDTGGLTALHDLPPTLEQGSPHGGTHRVYRVEPTDDGQLVAYALAEIFDSEKGNLGPSWGEVQVANQYVVGAGSQLDGCDKEWCDECEQPDGGRYVLQNDREIATIQAEYLIEVLAEDPALDRTDESDSTEEATAASSDASTSEPPTLTEDADPAELVKFGRQHNDNFDALLDGDYSAYRDSDSKYGVDRSKAEAALVTHLSYWLGGDRRAVESMIDDELPERTRDGAPTKWHDRGDSYRESTLQAVDVPTDYFDPSEFDPSDPSELDYDEVERGLALLQSETGPTDPAGDLEHQNGCYGIRWTQKNEDGEVVNSGLDTVCNFTLETVAFVETDEGTDIVLEVDPQNPREDAYEVRVEPTVFNSGETFRSEVVIGQTTWFDPSNRTGVPTTTILRYLRETVGSQAAPRRQGTPHIGLFPDYSEFVTPEGSLTADGWSEDPAYRFYSKGGDDDGQGALPQKWALSPEDDDEIDEDDVARICELLSDIRQTERGLPILGWFYAAPLKAYIHDWEDEFPLLAPKGGTGTGKTSALRVFHRAFGGDGSPSSASDSAFTMEKHFGESRGFPVWIDEYKPSEMDSRRNGRLHRRLKEVTKERVLPKGTPDLGEVTFHLTAPVVVSGEQKITDAPVRRRAVITDLSLAATEEGSPTKAAFGELTGTAYDDEDGETVVPDGYDLGQHARAYLEWALDRDAADLKRRWVEARERVKSFEATLGNSLDESERRGLQTVVFGVSLHRRFAEAIGADPDELPDDSDVTAACEHVVANIGKDGQRRDHDDEFIDLLTRAATDGYVEHGVHHRVLESEKFGAEVLAIHLPSTFSAVKRYLRDSNLEDEYNTLSRQDYLDSFKNKAEASGSYVLATSKRTRKIENGSRAVYFDHAALSARLGEDFDIDAFRPESEDSGPDLDGQTPLGALEIQRSASFVAEVAAVSDGEYSREAQGELKGPHGTYIGFVVPGDSHNQLEGAQGATYHFDNVTVRTDDDGLREAVINDATELTETDGFSGPADDSGDETPAAAADGGQAKAVAEASSADTAAESVEDGDDDDEVERDEYDLRVDETDVGANMARIVRTLSGKPPKEKDELRVMMTLDGPLTPDEFDAALEKGLEVGELYETPQGEIDSK